MIILLNQITNKVSALLKKIEWFRSICQTKNIVFKTESRWHTPFEPPRQHVKCGKVTRITEKCMKRKRMKDKNNKVENEWNQIIPFYLACEPMARDTDSPSLGHRECLSGGEVRNHWRRHLTTLKSGCRRIPLLDTMRRCGTRLPTDSAPHHCCWDEARLKLRACRGRHQLTFLTEYSRGSSCCTSFINRNCQWMKNHKKRSRIKASAGPIGPMSESSQR
jgi:hypothetical protein